MTQSNPYIGKKIGNYRIEKEIDRGAFGGVYLAQHLYLTERLVVAKLLHLLYLGSEEEQANFLREAQFLERLEHPHILTILDVGIDDDRPYIIAEYAQKGSLRNLLKRYAGQPLPPVEAVSILTQVGQGLQYAHQQNIIHRDLKPENILFNARGDALLADFGISTVLSTASIKHTDVIGTPAYMAPEQFRGIVSKESDQYALGCIAYELFTGQRPFTAPDFVSMGFKHTTELPTPPGRVNPNVMPYIEDIILKAIAKERADRYPDVASFVAALQNLSPLQDMREYGARQAYSFSTQREKEVIHPYVDDRYKTSSEKNLDSEAATLTQRKTLQSQSFASDLQPNEKVRGGGATYRTQAVIANPGDPFEAIPGGLRAFAGLNYLFFPVTALIFLIVGIGRQNRFTRFHVMQSFLLWLFLCLLIAAIVVAPNVPDMSNYAGPEVVLAIILVIALLCLPIAMIAAFLSRSGKIPLFAIGAETFASKRSS